MGHWWVMVRDEMGNDQNRNRKKSSSRNRKGSSSNVDPEGAAGDEAATAGAKTAMLHPKSSNHSGASSNKKRGRHESTDTEASEISATLERAPPDGGWG